MTITCTINGVAQQIGNDATVADLLDIMHLHGQKIAVEKNGVIVPKSRHHNEPLQNNDVVEIVTAVGGG